MENKFCQSVQTSVEKKTEKEKEKKQEEEAGDDLSVYVMNILLKVSSLPSLLAINLMKMEI